MQNLNDRCEEEDTRGDVRLSCQARIWGDVTVETPKGLTRERVEEVLNKIRDYVAQDGGYIELVDVSPTDGVVSIRFQGACSG